MTDAGTLIMRNSPAAASEIARQKAVTSRTELPRKSAPSYPAESGFPSIAPFALDLDDYAEPARNSDAFGTNRRNRTTDAGLARSTTKTSFFAGLGSGLLTLTIGIAIGFIAFTNDEGIDVGTIARQRHAVAHVASSLHVAALETAELKATARKHVHRAFRRGAPDGATEAVPQITETE